MSIRFYNRRIVLGGLMPKVTEAHVEARKHQIMDAAATCFSRTGFHHTTMHDICQMAELSPGAVYRYFRSKEEIIESMMRERQASSAAIIEAVRGRGRTLEVLDEMADVFFSQLENEQKCALSVELWAESLRAPRIRQLLRSELRDISVPFAQIIRNAQDVGEVNPRLKPESVAQVLISLFDGCVLQKTADDQLDVAEYVAVMKSMINGTFWQSRKLEGVD
jgi:AcrR family transcriptional regulator